MRRGIFYQDDTMLSELTVGELRDLIIECFVQAQRYKNLTSINRDIEERRKDTDIVCTID